MVKRLMLSASPQGNANKPLCVQACYTEAANQRSAGRAPAETKRCRRCGSTKEAADFYISKMTADGLQSYCKACYAVASAARRSRNHQDQVFQLPVI